MRVNKVRLSKMFFVVLSFHVVDFLLFEVMEEMTGNHLRSWGNYYEEGVLDMGKALQMLIFYPLKEELVFRIIIFTLLVNRSKRVVNSAVIANILFACMHLLNLFNGFSASYVFFQTLFCFLIGFFYSLRFILSSSPLEGILFHVFNNIVTFSFLPPPK